MRDRNVENEAARIKAKIGVGRGICNQQTFGFRREGNKVLPYLNLGGDRRGMRVEDRLDRDFHR